MLQDVERQHALQGARLPTVAGLGVEHLDQGIEFAPRHDLFHFGQKLRSTGLPAVLVEAYARQDQLPHFSQ
jgi:hypothetical protein